MTRTRRHPPRRSPGFSLIEILVVISIIGVLAGIGFVAARSMMKQAEIEQANATVAALGGVPVEILASSDKPLRYMDYPAPGTFNAAAFPADPVSIDPIIPDAKNSINFLIQRGNGNPTTKAMLQSINREFFKYGADPDDVTEQYIVDPWGQPLRFSSFSDNGTPAITTDDFYGATANNSGTGNYLRNRGMPKQRAPYVASAGPDGLWGAFDADGEVVDATVDINTDGTPDAQDNIYSFDLK